MNEKPVKPEGITLRAISRESGLSPAVISNYYGGLYVLPETEETILRTIKILQSEK